MKTLYLRDWRPSDANGAEIVTIHMFLGVYTVLMYLEEVEERSGRNEAGDGAVAGLTPQPQTLDATSSYRTNQNV